MAERSIGGIVGYLRLDRSDWDIALNLAGKKADELSKHSPNIRVTASTGQALAQLALLRERRLYADGRRHSAGGRDPAQPHDAADQADHPASRSVAGVGRLA